MNRPASKKSRIQTACHTLVVIDVQEGYLSNWKVGDSNEIKTRIKSVVSRYSDRGCPVLFVYWPRAGRIPRDILKAANLRKCVRKYHRDGAIEVIDSIADLGWQHNIHICGGFTSKCLRDTVRGLVRLTDWPVTVVKSACYDEDGGYRPSYLGQMRGVRAVP